MTERLTFPEELLVIANAECGRLREVNAELLAELIIYHDREWDLKSRGGLPTHEGGDWPADCPACAAIAKATAMTPDKEKGR